MALLTLNSANSKTSNSVFKTEVPSQDQKPVKVNYQTYFLENSVICKTGQPL